MSLFSAIHTYDSRISADGNFEREKEETMEKIINNAPFALVLVFLVIGFVLLIKGADFFVEGSSAACAVNHYRTYHRCDGNIPSGDRSQCVGIPCRQQ